MFKMSAVANLLRFAHYSCYFGCFIQLSSTLRIASFNAGLAPTVPYFEDRRDEIVPALEELNADILCLQEVNIVFSNLMTSQHFGHLGISVLKKPKLKIAISAQLGSIAQRVYFLMNKESR